MSKQVVDKIIANIINEDNSSTISTQAIESLLELKDKMKSFDFSDSDFEYVDELILEKILFVNSNAEISFDLIILDSLVADIS